MPHASSHMVLDHLIVAGPSLEEATRYVEALLGERASPGGSHPGVGTRNALIGLAGGAYLEIIGPDPEQPEPDLPRWFGIDRLRGPRLVTWCARTLALAASHGMAASAGVDLGAISRGGRTRPDGSELSWRVTDPRADRFDGMLPFLIDWGGSEHPSASLEARCACQSLGGTHPLAGRIQRVVDALGLPVELREGPDSWLEAEIRTPGGVVTLR